MSMTKVASRRTYKLFAAGDNTLTVENSQPVTVYGIEFQAVSAAVYTIKDADADTEFVYSLAANTSDCIGVCWKADKGITVTSSEDDGSACVFHDSPGT